VTLASDLIQETRALLYSGQEPEHNRLNGSVTDTQTTMTFGYPLGSITRGAIVSVDLEDVRIWATSGQVATVVERGVNGTTKADHDDLSLVDVRPRFSDFRILRAINQDLADLCAPSNGLYQVKTADLTYSVATASYDMTGIDRIGAILEVRYKIAGSSKTWPVIPSTSYALYRNMATSEFSSGFALNISEGGYPGQPIRVRYADDFDVLAELDDDVLDVTGLPVSAHDLPPLGAAIRLVSAREVARNFMESQPEPRRGEEVPPGAVMQSVNGLRAIRATRIIAEAARLQSDWNG
jgi:hypothetical protein